MSVLPPGVSPTLALLLAAVSFFSSMLTAAAGLGGGAVMLATIASVVPAPAVIPVHGVIQLGSNVGRALVLRAHIERRVLGFFTLGAVLGAVLGGHLYVALPAEVLQLVIGAFILYTVWGPKFRRVRIVDRAFAAVGAATTFLTMFVGGTGPFVAAFISPDRFAKTRTVATHAACMTSQHGLKVAVFAALGFAFGPWLGLLAVLIASGFLGTLTGRAVLVRLPERTFALVFKAVLSVLALRLLWSALGGLLG